MRKYIPGLILLAGSFMLTGYLASDAETDKQANGSYLQESMVRVQLPAEGPQEIVRLVRVGKSVAALSSDKIFMFEN